jgi:predicted acyltransferase
MGQTGTAGNPELTTVAAAQGRTAQVSANTAVKPARLMSLDVFRGATIAAMILVNNPGNNSPYPPLQHAEWNGWTPTDLIFPFCLFIVGVSLVLSFASRLRRGESQRELLAHSVRRSAVLFAIGVLLNFSLPLSTWRIPGVLQRIALCYLAAAAITLYTGMRARIVWTAALLLGYWAVIRLIPVPGYGIPGSDIPVLQRGWIG